MNEPGSYAVKYDPRAMKELLKLDKPIARRIATAIEGLAVQPRPPSARVLVGYPRLRRVRIGDYRVVYAIEEAELVVLVLRVAHRRHVYRSL